MDISSRWLKSRILPCRTAGNCRTIRIKVVVDWNFNSLIIAYAYHPDVL
jgi:hypothetical protein